MNFEGFRKIIADAGLNPPDSIIADGNIHSFPTNGKATDTAGRYCAYDGIVPGAWVMDFRTGLYETWSDQTEIKTDADKEHYRNQSLKLKQKREEENQQRLSEGIEKATKNYQKCEPAKTHPYLDNKGVQVAPGICIQDGKLVIPMRNATGQIQSLQFIGKDKRYMTGGIVSGTYFSIGKPNEVLCICEGLATGLSIHEATNHAVAVAFDSGNLGKVAKIMRQKFPDTRIIICADNDHQNERNIGLDKATEAAQSIGAELAVPECQGTDYNDMHQELGLDAVKACIDADKAEVPGNDVLNTSDPNKFSTWMEGYTLTNEEAEKIQRPDWIYKNLIISNHLIVIPAPPNGGKTTILFQISCDLAKDGFSVYYINADISGGDAREMIEEANRCGVTLLLPDFKGSSMEKLVLGLVEFIDAGTSFDGSLFVFDTLKKMTDVISKKQSKELYSMLRRMTAQGATIVLLAHCNKYRDAEGKLIYEGTGDLRSDVDELIYLDPVHNDNGTITVSTIPDKKRGAFEPITWIIDADRNIKLTGYVDTSEQNRTREQRAKDDDCIQAINQAISNDIHTQEAIADYCQKTHSFGKRTVRRVLRAWSEEASDPIWEIKRGIGNAKRYHMTEKQSGG